MLIIHEASDADLRTLIHKHDLVIVKFVDENCQVCKELAPSFQGLAGNPKYRDVLFLRMNAAENPVSSKQVKLSGTPFIATYRKGRLQDCGLITSEAEVAQMLDKLLKK